MRVGLSLLTLSPGDHGGSETYARELVRSLATVGTLDYAVLVPARAKDAAEGLPAIEVKDPPVAKRWRSRYIGPPIGFSIHARRDGKAGRRHQAVDRTAEEASLTGIRPNGASPS